MKLKKNKKNHNNYTCPRCNSKNMSAAHTLLLSGIICNNCSYRGSFYHYIANSFLKIEKLPDPFKKAKENGSYYKNSYEDEI